MGNGVRRLHQVIAVTGLIAFLSGPVAFAIPLLDIDGGSTLNLPASHDILAENTEGLINANLKALADVSLEMGNLEFGGKCAPPRASSSEHSRSR